MPAQDRPTTARTVLAASVFALCWLLPNHHKPWADFYSDAWAGLVLCAIGVWVSWRSRNTAPMAWHALPIVALGCCAIVWFQYAQGLIATLGVAWINSLYLLGLALALLLGAAWERWRPEQCADFLFVAALIGATGSLLVQLQQWLQIDPGTAFWLFIPAPPNRYHANLGQPNQLASLLCLGVLGCAWLFLRGRWPGWLAWPWAVALAVGMALTESRTSWLVTGLALLALVVFRRRPGVGVLLPGAAAWAAVYGGFITALPHINLWLGKVVSPQAVRGISGNEIRLDLWLANGQALLTRPWQGFGWGQVSHAQFAADPARMLGSAGSASHSHNLFLDLLLYLGLPLGLFVIGVLTVWGVKALRRVDHAQHLWMLLFVGALLVHALLEYPLHYAYFLLPLGLMLGALNAALGFAPVFQSRRWPIAVLMAVAALGLGLTARDYLRIEQAFFGLRFEHNNISSGAPQPTPDTVLLTHLRDLFVMARTDPAAHHSAADIAWAENAVKTTPSLMGMYKLAAMHALADQPDRAAYWLQVMIRINGIPPAGVRELQQRWAQQAETHPALAQVPWPQP